MDSVGIILLGQLFYYNRDLIMANLKQHEIRKLISLHLLIFCQCWMKFPVNCSTKLKQM